MFAEKFNVFHLSVQTKTPLLELVFKSVLLASLVITGTEGEEDQIVNIKVAANERRKRSRKVVDEGEQNKAKSRSLRNALADS